jgi:hypothetical protein
MGELDGTELVDWRRLAPEIRRAWWEELWGRTIALTDRYRLALRRGWWDDPLQVEALATFVAWLRLYDTGAYNDPPGKLQLLWELERLRAILRAGDHAFDPDRDRPAFDRHLDAVEHPPPDTNGSLPPVHGEPGAPTAGRPDHELAAVIDRLQELRERRALLADARDANGHRGADRAQVRQDLGELEIAIAQLAGRERELRDRLDRPAD